MKEIWVVGICYWCRGEIKSNIKHVIYSGKLLLHDPKCLIKYLEHEIADKEKEIELLNEWFVDKRRIK